MTPKRYSIIHEDDALIVVDKPSGLLVIPTPKKETNTLTDLINRDLDERGIEANAYPCHRIDRETSGLVMYAKGKHFQQLMMGQFKDRSIRKQYIAFVRGNVKNDTDTIKGYIKNINKRRNDLAITKYRVIGRKREFTVVEVEPVTGRTNQIRIQFKSIGHPLLGETVYAFRKDFKIRFKRVALHAHRLEFTHPATKTKVICSSPLPDDMENFLENNR